MALLGYVLQRGVLNFTLGDDILPPLLVTFGLSVIIQNALLEGYRADPQKMNVGALVVMLKAPRGLWGIIRSRWGIQLFPLGYRIKEPSHNKTASRFKK